MWFIKFMVLIPSMYLSVFLNHILYYRPIKKTPECSCITRIIAIWRPSNRVTNCFFSWKLRIEKCKLCWGYNQIVWNCCCCCCFAFVQKNSGSKNRRNGVISGSRNCRKGRQILYAITLHYHGQYMQAQSQKLVLIHRKKYNHLGAANVNKQLIILILFGQLNQSLNINFSIKIQRKDFC